VTVAPGIGVFPDWTMPWMKPSPSGFCIAANTKMSIRIRAAMNNERNAKPPMETYDEVSQSGDVHALLFVNSCKCSYLRIPLCEEGNISVAASLRSFVPATVPKLSGWADRKN